MREDEESRALFEGDAPLPEDLARLRERLARLPLPGEPDWSAAPARMRRERPGRRLAWLAAAAALLALAAGTALVRDAWRVEPLAGSPTLRGLAFAGRVALGGTLATDGASRARLEVPGLGEVELEPGGLLRRVRGHAGERRLALEHGTLHARVTAPPRLFVVETRSGVATDLGCAYTLTIGDDGTGLIHVTQGRVVFADHGRESFVAAGVSCPVTPGGVGLPRRDYASDAFLAALAAWERSQPDTGALDRLLASAEASDALTLWHLLPRVAAPGRERVARRMAALIEVPADVPVERVVALEPAALDAWWGAIGMGPAREWRAGAPKRRLGA